MSIKSPKLPPPPPILPSAEDNAARAAAELEFRKNKGGRKSVSLTALRKNKQASIPPTLTPGRNSVVGG